MLIKSESYYDDLQQASSADLPLEFVPSGRRQSSQGIYINIHKTINVLAQQSLFLPHCSDEKCTVLDDKQGNIIQ